MAYFPESHELSREYGAMMKRLESGEAMHPMEIWELAERLRDGGAAAWADRLVGHLPDDLS